VPPNSARPAPDGLRGPDATDEQTSRKVARTLRVVQPAALDVHGVAALLGVSHGLVEQMNARGELPRPIRLHRRRVWVRAEIEAWLLAGAPNRERWEATRGGRP
jgi:predicted DNA-binding transcriptional regulator AlpA